MPTYITLFSLTQQGIQSIKESPNRLEAAKKTCASLGVNVQQFYLVLGRYDAVVISEASSDEAVATAMLTLGSAGNVRSETLRAFNEDEYAKIIGGLP